MRCSFDGMDDLVVGDDFKNDPSFGFVHKLGGSWHTISGMLLRETNGVFSVAPTEVVEPMTVMAEQ